MFIYAVLVLLLTISVFTLNFSSVFLFCQSKRWTQDYGSAQQPDPYANQEPPPLGFDLMSKSDYTRPNPMPGFDFSKLFPTPPGDQGMPDPLRGYQPYPAGATQYPAQGHYDPQYQGAPGYQQMPSQGYPYGQGPDYQQNQYYGNAPGHGYPPSGYGATGPPPVGFQPNQYYNQPPGQSYSSPYPNQTGYPPPGGPGYAGYQPPPGPGAPQYAWGSGHGQAPQHDYPYGQGEVMHQAQSAPQYMSEPGVSKPVCFLHSHVTCDASC